MIFALTVKAVRAFSVSAEVSRRCDATFREINQKEKKRWEFMKNFRREA